MTIDALIARVQRKSPPAAESDVSAFEAEIGASLPADYREFLVKCNGGARLRQPPQPPL